MPIIRHTVRVGRVVFGCLLLVGGAVLALPGVPGPGIVLVVGGLALLSDEFPWARRWHERIRDGMHRITRRQNG